MTHQISFMRSGRVMPVVYPFRGKTVKWQHAVGDVNPRSLAREVLRRQHGEAGYGLGAVLPLLPLLQRGRLGDEGAQGLGREGRLVLEWKREGRGGGTKRCDTNSECA